MRELVGAFDSLTNCLDPTKLAGGAVCREFDRKKASEILFNNFANLIEKYIHKYKSENGSEESVRDIASHFYEVNNDNEDFFGGFHRFFKEELKDAKSLEARVTSFALEMACLARLSIIKKLDEKDLMDVDDRVREFEKEVGCEEGFMGGNLRQVIPIYTFLPSGLLKHKVAFCRDFLPEGKYFFLKERLAHGSSFPSVRKYEASKERDAVVDEMNNGMLSNINKALPGLDLMVVQCGAKHCNYLYGKLRESGHEVIKMACINEYGSFSQRLRSYVGLPSEDYVTSFAEAKRRVDGFIPVRDGASIATATGGDGSSSVLNPAASRLSVLSEVGMVKGES